MCWRRSIWCKNCTESSTQHSIAVARPSHPLIIYVVYSNMWFGPSFESPVLRFFRSFAVTPQLCSNNSCMGARNVNDLCAKRSCCDNLMPLSGEYSPNLITIFSHAFSIACLALHIPSSYHSTMTKCGLGLLFLSILHHVMMARDDHGPFTISISCQLHQNAMTIMSTTRVRLNRGKIMLCVIKPTDLMYTPAPTA